MNSFSVPDAAIRLNQASSKDREAFGQMFDSFAGQTDTLTVEQAKLAVQSVIPDISPQMLSRLSNEYGRTVSRSQFEQFMTRVFLDAQPANEIRRAFQLIDVNKTGTITASQLQDAMESFGDRPDIAETEAMIHEAAHTFPDKVTIDELISFLLSEDD
ncbi:hypothetical protein INT43_006279 [Umbelopsis isabellina]|uniref:EF-hand domain-containing protein n=1 Tax=Mortierella isabellina TaxID=91625 RepID=A0A8H7UHI1_MORIS|nr:hypothetical protein INT43_006279 [Umbelopsis isabellina]